MILLDTHACAREGCLKSSWTGGSALLLCRGRQWLLRQIGVVGVT